MACFFLNRSKHFLKIRNKNRKWKLVLILSILIIAFNEYFVYEWCHWQWILNDHVNVNSEAKKYNILLVADPQLIGFTYEYKLFGPIIRWDADRFIKSGFSKALRYTRPDAVLFLGDIFDEGEIASESQFDSYMSRFQNIFMDLIDDKTMVIIIPGDNDIGGENSAERDRTIVQRFNTKFNHSYPYIKSLGNIDFIAADIRSSAEFQNTLRYIQTHSVKQHFNVLLNHESVNINQKLLPSQYDIQLVVTAHTHLSNYRLCTDRRERPWICDDDVNLETYDSIQFHVPLESPKRLEITIPTCSYRMGVPYPGYGFLKLSEDGHILYSVLWLPFRYYSLAFYCTYLIVIFILACFGI